MDAYVWGFQMASGDNPDFPTVKSRLIAVDLVLIALIGKSMFHCEIERVFLVPTLSSLAAPQVVVTTTCGATSDDKAGTMTMRCLYQQTSFEQQVLLVFDPFMNEKHVNRSVNKTTIKVLVKALIWYLFLRVFLLCLTDLLGDASNIYSLLEWNFIRRILILSKLCMFHCKKNIHDSVGYLYLLQCMWLIWKTNLSHS